MTMQIEFKAMGCQMLAALDDDEQGEALKQVPAWFEEWEQSLSRFRENSELSELNRRAGQYVPVSPVLWEVLNVALVAAEQSGGLVVPTILPALLAAGYDRSFDQMSAKSDRSKLDAPATLEQWHNIEMEDEGHFVYLPPNTALDFGGVAKGWAAQQAVQRLAQYGPALMDAGGDVATSGPRADGSSWPIGISDPFAPDKELELLLLAGNAVATSGRDYRRWQQGGQWKHHIIDPRTGQPAATDIFSATVVAPDTVAAEVAAKTALIMGSAAAIPWLDCQPSLAGLLVREDATVIYSQHMAQHLWR